MSANEAIIAICALVTLGAQILTGAYFYGKLSSKVDDNRSNTSDLIGELRKDIRELRSLIWPGRTPK